MVRSTHAHINTNTPAFVFLVEIISSRFSVFGIVSMLSGLCLAGAELKTNKEMSRKKMMDAVEGKIEWKRNFFLKRLVSNEK